MIRYIQHEEIDRKKWDLTIERSFNGNICAFGWFLDLVSPDWDALVLDDYKAVMPLTHRKKFGISYLFQPSFSQQLGVFSTEILSATLIAEFLKAIPVKFRLIEINLNKFNNTGLIESRLVIKQVTHELELIKPYEQIRKGYSENTKRNIRKAESSGIYVRPNIAVSDIIKLFRENTGKQFEPQPDNHYKILIRLVNDLVKEKKAAVLGAYSAFNHLCGGAVFVISHHKVIFLFSGLDESGRENGAMFLLIDDFIRNNSGLQLILDFEGSNQPSLARFYKSFGSEVVYYTGYRLNRLPFYLQPAFSIHQFTRRTKFKKS